MDRLDPADRCGVVAFDDEARVVVPTGPIVDDAALHQVIAAVTPGGMTNVSGGLLRGLREARRVVGAHGATLLLSDGHANGGIVDCNRLGAVAAKARTRGITTTTIGIMEHAHKSRLRGRRRDGA